MDGQKLMIKDLSSFSTEIPISVYYLHNNGHMKTLTSKLMTIIIQVRDIAIKKDLGEPYEGPIPLTAWRKNLPKILGQDTKQFQGWPQHLQQNRKVMHIYCDKGHSKIICDLVEVAKDEGLFEQIWGK